MLNAVVSLESLRVPPGNALEVLRRDRQGQHSVRINDQFRLCFVWTADGPKQVEIADYCAVRKIGDGIPETAQSGGESEEGRRPAPLGRARGEGRELAACLCKSEGLLRERSGASESAAFISCR
jgi:hypothetical protein